MKDSHSSSPLKVGKLVRKQERMCRKTPSSAYKIPQEYPGLHPFFGRQQRPLQNRDMSTRTLCGPVSCGPYRTGDEASTSLAAPATPIKPRRWEKHDQPEE